MLALAFAALSLRADDQITLTNGQVINGSVVSISGTQVMVQTTTSRGGIAKIPYQLGDIKSVTMKVPDAVAKAENPATPPEQAIAGLEPAIQQYAGLPAAWIVDAMGKLAEAYAASGHGDKASEMFTKIDTAYPNSKYHAQAVAGRASMTLKSGKVDQAFGEISPIIEQANQNLAPSPDDAATYARAFLVYGDILDAQKKPEKALEAYLTVKTMFYQDTGLVTDADTRAKALREKNPNLGVD
jgi:tetratricopeptide (TPR) repeat protein